MASAPTPSLVCPPQCFLSLPAEILAIVILYIDKPTALALRRVSRHFELIDISQQLFEEISLEVDDPPRDYNDLISEADNIESAKNAEAALSQRLVVKSQAVLDLLRLDPRLSGKVRCLDLTPRQAALGIMVEILQLVSPTLRTLRIFAPLLQPCDKHWRAGSADNLDTQLYDIGLSLPSLNVLELGHSAIHFNAFIPYLCSLAPSLSILSIDLEERVDQYLRPQHIGPIYPSLPPHENVKELQLTRDFFWWDDEETADLLIAHLRHFPNIHSVSIDYPLRLWGDYHDEERNAGVTSDKDEDVSVHDFVEDTPSEVEAARARARLPATHPDYDLDDGNEYEREEAMGLIVDALMELKHLVNLDWRSIRPREFFDSVQSGPGFEKLRCLILGSVDWSVLFEHFKPLPKLEAIYFTAQAPIARTASIVDLSQSDKSIGLPQKFALALRQSPALQYLVILEPFEIQPNLEMFSLIECLEEVIRPAVFSLLGKPGYDFELLHVVLPTQSSGASQHYTDYEGDVVPLDVLEEMQVEEGASNEEWRGRRRENGGRAARVLCKFGRSTGCE